MPEIRDYPIKEMREYFASLAVNEADPDGHFAIAYALLCIHEVMLQQQQQDAADHAEADQISRGRRISARDN